MAWKSREDKLPPPYFFSMMVAYLQRAYPGAQISRELMQTLRPFLIEAWQNGRTAEAAAQTTCSCDGRHIVPSPVIAVHIAKGSVRPPKGAQCGEVFGAEALREPPRIERMQRQLDRMSRAEQQRHGQASRWEERSRTARTESSRQEAARKLETTTAKRADLLAEAKRMEAQRLRQELNRSSVKQTPATTTAEPEAPARQAPGMANPRLHAEKAVAPAGEVSGHPTVDSRSPVEQPKQRKHKGRGRPKSPSIDSRPTSQSSASPEAQSAVMLRSVQGMLPDLAAQIAAQMVKDGSGK